MNVNILIAEVEEMESRVDSLVDNILDIYKNNPKECSDLLKEVMELKEDIVKLDKDATYLKTIS